MNTPAIGDRECVLAPVFMRDRLIPHNSRILNPFGSDYADENVTNAVGTPLRIGAKQNLSARHACLDAIGIGTSRQHENAQDKASGSQHSVKLSPIANISNQIVSNWSVLRNAALGRLFTNWVEGGQRTRALWRCGIGLPL